MKIFNAIAIPVLAGTILFGTQSCKKEDVEPTPTPTPTMMSSTYNYEFNNGQVVPTASYDGMHMDNLTATMKVEETASGKAMITVSLTNTIDGASYHIHAHDAADPTTTPNNTPYNETPNTALFTKMVVGNGGTVSISQEANQSYSEITSTYNGFLVVHDPTQAVSTTNISSYIVLGTFARAQSATNYSSQTFPYAFNTGQLSAAYAYGGTHATSLMGKLKIQQLADGNSRVTVMLDNTMNGQTYMVHAHDAADPATTPNSTPYNESPNSNVCTVMISGNGATAHASQTSTMSYSDITSVYNGFFVVHDPLQAINTADPTTYVLLGVFARN